MLTFFFLNKLCKQVRFCHFIAKCFYFLEGKQDVKTQSQINDKLRCVDFAVWHPRGVRFLGACQESSALHRESRQRRRELRSIWFSIKSFQRLQTTPSQPWQAHLHSYLCITILCTCRQNGAAVEHIHDITHTYLLLYTCTQDANQVTLTHSRVFHSVPHGQGCSEIWDEIFCEFNWFRSQTAGLWSCCRSGFTKMLTMGYLEAGGCFGQTDNCWGCFSDIQSLGIPLLSLYPHLHPKCANLLFGGFLSGSIWSLNNTQKW